MVVDWTIVGSTAKSALEPTKPPVNETGSEAMPLATTVSEYVPSGSPRRQCEIRRHRRAARGHAGAAPIEGAGEVNFPGRVFQFDDRIIAVHLIQIAAVARAGREAIQLRARQGVMVAACDDARDRRLPRRLRRTIWRVDIHGPGRHLEPGAPPEPAQWGAVNIRARKL